jgi:hypothetical protein
MTQQIQTIAVPADLIQAIGDYLTAQPYKEVANLVGNLQSCINIQQAANAVKAKAEADAKLKAEAEAKTDEAEAEADAETEAE